MGVPVAGKPSVARPEGTTRLRSGFAASTSRFVRPTTAMFARFRGSPGGSPTLPGTPKHDFFFPYVVDETQKVARVYDALCTPEFFGFNAALELQYRGRLDASRTTLVPDAQRELSEAMCRIAETGKGPTEQHASMGCSIKWRE